MSNIYLEKIAEQSRKSNAAHNIYSGTAVGAVGAAGAVAGGYYGDKLGGKLTNKTNKQVDAIGDVLRTSSLNTSNKDALAGLKKSLSRKSSIIRKGSAYGGVVAGMTGLGYLAHKLTESNSK